MLLDDIQDGSPVRRGKTATLLIFGEAQSINSATFLYVRVVQEVQATGNAALMTVLLEELEDLHVGQSWDLYWKYNLKWPTKDEYFSMIDLKTGGLFRMLMRMMQALSPRPSTEFVCDALIIHCLENSPRNADRIMGLFRQRTGCSGPMPSVAKVQIIQYLQEAGCFEACWEFLNKLDNEIEDEIKSLEAVTGEDNPQMNLLLKLLSVENEKPNKAAVVVPIGL